MGKKEKLIIEYFALRHQFDVNEGDNCKKPWNEEPTKGEIREWMGKYKVIDLEEKIEAVKNSLEFQNKRLKIKAYYNTKEGADLKEYLESKREYFYNKFMNLQKEYHTNINNLVVDVLGNKFTTVFVGDKYSCRLEIGIINNDKNRKGLNFKFGHDFTVTYDSNWYKTDKTKYELNISCASIGSFNAITDKDRIDYVIGFGKFVSNTELKNKIIDLFKEFINLAGNISDEIDAINNKLNNPFD